MNLYLVKSRKAIGGMRIFTAVSALLVFAYVFTMDAIAATGLGNAFSTGGGLNLQGSIIKIVNAFLTLVATIAVVFIVFGGIQYIVSAGDDKKAAAAKSTILYAIIGLIIVGLAGAIVAFVINPLTGGGGVGSPGSNLNPGGGGPSHPGPL